MAGGLWASRPGVCSGGGMDWPTGGAVLGVFARIFAVKMGESCASGSPSSAPLPFLSWGEGSPTKIDYLILTSLLEDLGIIWWLGYFLRQEL